LSAISAGLRLSLGAALLLAAAAPSSRPAAASGTPAGVEFVWTLHLGGLSIGTIGFKSQFQGDTYAAVTKLKTSGVLNSFYAATIDASSSGQVRGGRLEPATYSSHYAGEKSSQKVQLAYAAGTISLQSEPAYDTQRFPVTDAQKAGTVDPISGVVQAVSGITATAANPCGATVRVFDGKRRYDIDLTLVEMTELQSSNGGYSGPAALCHASYRQVAGFKQELQKRELPPVQVWMAKFPSQAGGPVQAFMVPVKIQTETQFGAAVANARNIAINGQRIGG
jgi:hypothetical protein